MLPESQHSLLLASWSHPVSKQPQDPTAIAVLRLHAIPSPQDGSASYFVMGTVKITNGADTRPLGC